MADSRKRLQFDAILDLEGQDMDCFVLAGFYDIRTKRYRCFRWYKEETLARFLLYEFEGICWAHFGGGYDYKWLLDWAIKLGVKASIITSGIGVVVIKTDRATFADSFRVVPTSLEAFTRGLGVTKQSLKLPCLKTPRCAPDCKGFCQIRRDASEEVLKKIEEYNYYDCVSLAEALITLQAYADTHDLDLTWTVGSSSWTELKRVYDIQANSLPLYEHRFTRAAYFGGRVQLFKHGRYPIVHQYDVNALYPSRLAHFTVPVGEPRWFIGKRAKARLLDRCQGMYECEVEVPYMYMPPLPVRYKKASSVSIGYPFGKFRGIWTGVELLNAIKHGVKVKCIRGLVWPSEENLFRDAVEKWWNLRLNAPGGKKSGLGEGLKYRMNSPTGKMGAREEKTRYDLFPDDIRKCKCRNAEEKMRCRCAPHTQVADNIFLSVYSRLDDCARIEFASTLTSRGRVELHEFVHEDMDPHNLVYCDTDGVKTLFPVKSYKIGKDLGQWLDEGPGYDFSGIAPKVYSYLSGILCAAQENAAVILDSTIMQDGKMTKNVIIKSKGGKLFERPVPGVESQKWGVRGIHQGAAHGEFFRAKWTTRRFKRQYGDRLPVIGTDETRAPSINEIKMVDPLVYVKG